MTKIGLYVYQLHLHDAESYKHVAISQTGKGSELNSFIPKFIANRTTANQNPDLQRSWRFDPAPQVGRTHHGLIRYGTFGFTSSIIDPSSTIVAFKRKPDHIEEIPLYYHFWLPLNGHVGFVAFQSFGERSCVSAVLGDFTSSFNAAHNAVKFSPRKIMPATDVTFKNATVKKVILSKKKVPKDRAEILKALPPDEFNIELSLSLKRRGRFGILSDVASTLRNAKEGSAFVIDGIEFDEAAALVKVGTTYMRVGIIGPSNNAGVIDITDRVALGPDQHPTLASLQSVTTSVISDFRQAFGM